jgi:hypothetical protein
MALREWSKKRDGAARRYTAVHDHIKEHGPMDTFVIDAKPMIKSLFLSSGLSARMLATISAAVAPAKSADVKFFQSGHARTILLDRPSALNAINM